MDRNTEINNNKQKVIQKYKHNDKTQTCTQIDGQKGFIRSKNPKENNE